MPSFHFTELPPTTNHAYAPGIITRKDGRVGARIMKTNEAQAWAEYARFIVGPWEPAPKTPLAVHIDIFLNSKRVHVVDIDAMLKALIDATIGKRHDGWVMALSVAKSLALGGHEGATVSVQEMLEGAVADGLDSQLPRT